MFGVDLQEMVLIGLLLLIVFGPHKLSSMAWDFGRFQIQTYNGARHEVLANSSWGYLC
jgi:Sec-independent protein translocase protein TatA